MSFVVLDEEIIPEGDPGATEGHDPAHESMHRLHNARGRVYFTADAAFAESAPGAADGGAKGNGVDDDTNAINAAVVLCNAEGGGEVVLTGQEGDTFLISMYTVGGNKAGAVWMRSNVTLTGLGRGTSILRLADAQGEFIRPISGPTAQSNIEIRNLQVDGNYANQDQANNAVEHQAGINMDAWIDVLIENVYVHDTGGDGIAVSTSTTLNCIRPVLRGCRMTNVYRVGIILNRCEQAEVSGCHFYGGISNCIKVEVDNDLTSISNPFFACDGAVISGCICDASDDALASGIVMSGSNAGTRIRDIVVTGCDFIGCKPGVSIGVIGSDGFNISDNNFRACERAVSVTSYAAGNGYAGHVGVVISNNNIREASTTNAAFYQIDIANATDVNISGNTIHGAGIQSGIRLQQCTEFTIVGGAIRLGAVGGTGSGVFIYRSYNGTVAGAKVTSNGSVSRAVTVSLDSAYPLGLIGISGITHISGGTATSSILLSVDPSDTTALTSHTVGTVGITTDCTGPVVAGADDGRSAFPYVGRHSFAGIRKTVGTAAPTTGTWTRGDTCENTNKTELGVAGAKYVLFGWACVTTGTPGTWKELRMLTGA